MSHLLTLLSEITLKRVADANKLLRAYQQHYQSWADTCHTHAKETRRLQLRQSKHNRDAYRHVAANLTASLVVALQKDDGSFVTGAIDIDELLRDKWASVYQGNALDQHAATQRYLDKYSRFLFRAAPQQLPPLDPVELAQLMAECGPSAAGFDSLTYEDFRWRPHVVFVHLCLLL